MLAESILFHGPRLSYAYLKELDVDRIHAKGRKHPLGVIRYKLAAFIAATNPSRDQLMDFLRGFGIRSRSSLRKLLSDPDFCQIGIRIYLRDPSVLAKHYGLFWSYLHLRCSSRIRAQSRAGQSFRSGADLAGWIRSKSLEIIKLARLDCPARHLKQLRSELINFFCIPLEPGEIGLISEYIIPIQDSRKLLCCRFQKLVYLQESGNWYSAPGVLNNPQISNFKEYSEWEEQELDQQLIRFLECLSWI